MEPYCVTNQRLGFQPQKKYDLNIAILTHYSSDNLFRVKGLRRFGLLNQGTQAIHVTLLVNPGDFKTADRDREKWSKTLDVTVLEFASKEPIPKINGYYLWLSNSPLQACWHARIDDDSVTDIGEACRHLTSEFGDNSVHLATWPCFENENEPILFRPYLENKKIFLPSILHESESSFTSDAAIRTIFASETVISLLKDTAQMWSGPGDRTLAVCAHIAGVPVIRNPRSTACYNPNDLTIFGGSTYHIHYVPWDATEFVTRIATTIGVKPDGIEERNVGDILGNPMAFSLVESSPLAILTLLDNGSIIGGHRYSIITWSFYDGRLNFCSDNGSCVISFTEVADLPSETRLIGAFAGGGTCVLTTLYTATQLRDASSLTSLSTEARICRYPWKYFRLSYDLRVIALHETGLITEGSAGCEKTWKLCEAESQTLLEIYGENGLTCSLEEGIDGVWRGTWVIGECMDVALVPYPGAKFD